MNIRKDKLQQSIEACIDNSVRLIEDAEWSLRPASTGLALALLAQEEAAKAFILTLVRDGVVPWTKDVYQSLSVHEGKHLLLIIMEWLFSINEDRLKQGLNSSAATDSPSHLPPNVATAMNIFRHELIEQLGRRRPERCTEWRGLARRFADGKLDRMKQFALFVHIGRDGSLASEPSTTPDAYEHEFAHAKTLVDFAKDVERGCIFAWREYEMFTEIFKTMFDDHRPGAMPTEERFESRIPGVDVVKQTVTVANVVQDEIPRA